MIKSTSKNSFNSCPVELHINNNRKTLSIPISIKSTNKIKQCHGTSKSWNNVNLNYMDKLGYSSIKIKKSDPRKSINYDDPYNNNNSNNSNNSNNNFQKYDLLNAIKKYDAINNCKSAGIVPFTYINGTLKFLFQREKNPQRKKDSGWNDFGGKQINSKEKTADIAAREFSEETSCLFYLMEKIESDNNKSKEIYNLLKHNNELYYSEETIDILKTIIPLSQKYFSEKITEYVIPIFLSSKETYISYFVKVKYIPESDLPTAEDLHIPYEDRYLRECKWFSLDEIMKMNEKEFHKRLQITRIQQRIAKYNGKELFV
ncbi:nudix hydrolase [Cotonvirus japonicus]|uniref:Nudix hydrolase n=1 Tax=Cotonvirus japonicus TaxID=2811091 RepID=A0ABM7NT54_9VIRU|nr:nudix hydrolase [Cotonvirus japonicus]BCS83333.1 nudix hydrolase [Cotonvirus japonicus]